MAEIVLKRSYRDIRVTTEGLAETARRELSVFRSSGVELSVAVVDRLMDVLTVVEDESNPWEFRVLCPLCGWLSKPLRASGGNPTYRGMFIGTVCRVLGRHVKSVHKIYETRTYTSGNLKFRFFLCSKCDHAATSLLEILAHYVSEHAEKEG